MKLTILNTAGVYREKCPELWVEIAEELTATEDLQARWFGGVDASYEAFVRFAEAQTNGRVLFPGRVPPEEILALHQSGEVLLLISSEIEVFPLSVMEAARAGTPILCRRFPGHEEVLGPYPWCFRTRDEALALAKQLLADMPAARRHSRALFEARFMKDKNWYDALNRLADLAGITHGS